MVKKQENFKKNLDSLSLHLGKYGEKQVMAAKIGCSQRTIGNILKKEREEELTGAQRKFYILMLRELIDYENSKAEIEEAVKKITIPRGRETKKQK